MGGLAVAIDWERPVPANLIDRMLALIPHRAAGGTNRGVFGHAILGEARDLRTATSTCTVETAGDLSIVADLRLWDRSGLRSRAGGTAATVGMDDRRLLLEAYLRSGIGFLDDVNGDFAFVIWDAAHRLVLAVRDRFGVKPMYLERTDTGLRLASEPKQLVCTSDRPIVPNGRVISDLLTESFGEARFTYFEGVERVLPSMAIRADAAGISEQRFWNPSPNTVQLPDEGDPSDGFREQLIHSVGRRLGTAAGVVSQLSGGLDSSAIAASAAVLSERGMAMPPFYTVSAVFPGRDCDESLWIDEIVKQQPFPHRDVEPSLPDVAMFDEDMWEVDAPWLQPIRDMWTYPADVARDAGADLAFSGFGGDEVLDQNLLLPDLLRAGMIHRWYRSVRSYAAWSGKSRVGVTLRSARTALPRRTKDAIRALARPARRPRDSLIGADLWRLRSGLPPEPQLLDFGFPSVTQNLAIADGQDGLSVWSNDALGANYAYRGIDLSHPFLDRSVSEYVASIPIGDRPFDGRTKTLIRDGFSGLLPASVLDRPRHTSFDRYLAEVFEHVAPAYRSRYPNVSSSAEHYIDVSRYLSAIDQLGQAPTTREQRYALWSAWTLMAWLDGLDRYR